MSTLPSRVRSGLGKPWRVRGRAADVCALCDTPIEEGALGFPGPHNLSPAWNPGWVHGTRGTVRVHYGCAYLGAGAYWDQPEQFEKTPMFEMLAAWARRTFAPSLEAIDRRQAKEAA